MNKLGSGIKNSTIYRGALGHLREVVIIAGAYFVYMFIRKFLIADIEDVAVANAIKLISFEASGGLLWEQHWQEWLLERSQALVIFFNWAYIITFWPIIAVTAFIVYLKDRQRFHYYRNMLLLSLGFALLLFAAFPLAPPRFLPEYGFVDAIQRFGPSWYGGRDMAVYYNAYAAMPSVHFAWTLLFGVLFFRTGCIWLKPFGIIYPTMTFLAITITGNHYILDAVGGAAIITATFFLHEGLRRLHLRPSSSLSLVREYLGWAAVNIYGTLLRLKVQAMLALADTKSRFALEYLSGKKWKRRFQIYLSSVKADRT